MKKLRASAASWNRGERRELRSQTGGYSSIGEEMQQTEDLTTGTLAAVESLTLTKSSQLDGDSLREACGRLNPARVNDNAFHLDLRR